MNEYVALPQQRQRTPRSTYQDFCVDLSPRLTKPLQEMVQQDILTPRPPGQRRPQSARPDLQHGGDTVDSTYRVEFCKRPPQMAPARPTSARAAGMMIPRDNHTMLCMDENVEWQRKIKIMRAQVALERAARREKSRELEELLTARKAAQARAFRSRMTATPR